jgi:hypothetical protein
MNHSTTAELSLLLAALPNETQGIIGTSSPSDDTPLPESHVNVTKISNTTEPSPTLHRRIFAPHVGQWNYKYHRAPGVRAKAVARRKQAKKSRKRNRHAK